MRLQAAEDTESRFGAYVEGLTSVIGHADREGPLRDYCIGLVMPCERNLLARSATSYRLVVSMPPSPVVMFLLEKKLKQPTSPHPPNGRPSMVAPGAWAASSTTDKPRALANANISGIAQG